MKYLIQLVHLVSILFFSLFFISESNAQAVGEIRSKNVELICPVQSPIKEEYIRLEKAVITISSVDVNKTIIPTPQGVDGLRIVDVTNPRAIIQEALRIKVKKTGSSSSFIDFMNAEIWKDNTSGDDPHGHTFAIVELEDPNEALIEDNQTPTPDVFASFLIFDITRAMEIVSGSSTKTVIVDNPNSRQAHIDGNTTTYFDDVYVGYIDADNSLRSHTLRMEPELGMMITSQLSDKIDLHHIATIVSSSNITVPGASHNQFAIPTRITTTFNSQTLQPIPCDPNTSNSAEGKSHETVGEKLTDTKIRLYSALFGDRFIISGTTTDNSPDGGILVIDVDFTSSTTNASVTHKDHWKYDADRTNPTRKTSTISGFASSNTHTVIPKRYNNNTYLITANELASPRAARDIDGNALDDATQNIEITSDPTLGTNTFTGFSQGRKYSGSNEDYRLHANYLKIWKFNESNVEVEGYGSNDGPIGSYDVPEQSVSDQINGNFNPVLSPSGITSVQALATANSTDRQRGVNTVHHLRSIDNDEDIYVSWYSQGARVISIEDFPSNPVVKEKAFFDFYPTLTYDFKENPTFSESNHYFSMNGTHISSGVGQGFYKDFIPAALENYFMGVFDLMPDYGRTGLESDEKFMYASAIGEGKIPGETVDRNYLHGGGFFILRYFDDKIGGTITGYTGTNSTFDRSFRDVNLQGTFSVERNTTVASGATVNLLKNTNLNPKTGGGSEYFEIIGTVNVETLTEGGRGTIDVPIFVRNGGKLVVKAGAVVDFKKMVTVDPGGELRIESGTKVVFVAPRNICNGKLYILGTVSAHAKIHASLHADRESTIGNSSIIMRGQPESPSATPDFNTNYLQIQYADVENVYIHSTDIKMHWPVTIYSSVFSGKDAAYNYMPLVSLWFRDRTTTNKSFSKVYVDNCTFTDRAGKKADAGQYEINGIDISGYRVMSLKNSSFKFLKNAVYLDDCGSALIQNNTINGEFTGGEIGVYSTSNVGVLSSLVVPRFCSNTLKDNYIATQGFWNMTSKFYDNNYTRSYVGSGSISDDDIFYRSNTYDEYCLGIASIGVMMNHLRDFWWQGNTLSSEYGRNIFIIPSDRDDRWGCLPTDVLVNQQSDLEVHCGYNLFSVNSTLHIGADMSSIALHSAPNPALDISKNKWQKPGGGHQVRSSIPFAGTPIDQSQTSSANCGDKSLISFCLPPVNPCLVTQLPIKDTMDMGEVIDKYDSLWSNIADTTLSVFCRVTAAKHAFELSVVLDSVAIYENNVSDFGSIANGTTLPMNLRVTARALKGMSYERLGKRDSAILEYYQITQTSTALQADSLAAAWRMQYNYALANTANRDSAVRKYVDRVINDLHRIWGNSVAYKMVSNNPLDEEEYQANQIGISLEQNIPNPFEENTEISFMLPSEGIVQLVVIDILGNEVKTLVNGEGKVGRNVVNYRASELPEGVYFYRLQFGNKVITKKMQKNR